MKLYTVIIAALATLVGTASSAHAAAAATATLSDEEETPNLRRIAIDEKDDRELWGRGKGQEDTPPGIVAPWGAAGRGKGPNKEEEGGPLEILLNFSHVPDNDPDTNAAIIEELLTNKVVTIDGKSFTLDDVDVADGEDVNTFHLGFGDPSRRSLQDIKLGATTLITYCKYAISDQVYDTLLSNLYYSDKIDTNSVVGCLYMGIRTTLDQYEKTLGTLGFTFA